MSRPPEHVVSALRAVLAANRGLHEEAPTPPVSPELHARVEAVRSNNPGLVGPPLQEPEPESQPNPQPIPAAVKNESEAAHG